MEHHPLSDFERLVSMFGDWMHDEEMSRNHGDLGKLFEALDAPGADEDDSFSFGADDSNKGDDVSKLSAPQLHGLLVSLVGRQEAGPLQRTNGTPAAQQRQQMQLAHRVRQAMQDAPLALVDEAMHRIGEALREEQRKREEEGSGKRVDLANFESFLRKLRPLAPGERDGDAELMALAESQYKRRCYGGGEADGKRQPAWMSAVRSSISIDRFSMQRAQAKQASEMAQAANALTSLLGDGKIDVLGTLEASTKSLIPLAHMSTIRLILSNLRSAGFQPVESNVLLRALYSFSDEKYGAPPIARRRGSYCASSGCICATRPTRSRMMSASSGRRSGSSSCQGSRSSAWTRQARGRASAAAKPLRPSRRRHRPTASVRTSSNSSSLCSASSSARGS